MDTKFLSRYAADFPALRAIFITAMPDCLLFASWLREEESWSVEDVASYFGDLIRANRNGLQTLQSWSSEMQVTIESSDALIVLQELNQDFVSCAVFDRTAPLGMVRMQLKSMVGAIAEQLPQFQVSQRPRAARIMDLLRRYAPDPHAVTMRVSLRTGVPLDSLEHPEQMNEQQTQQVETTAKEILGLEQLDI